MQVEGDQETQVQARERARGPDGVIDSGGPAAQHHDTPVRRHNNLQISTFFSCCLQDAVTEERRRVGRQGGSGAGLCPPTPYTPQPVWPATTGMEKWGDL